ncbi:thioredoxin domain-containing protein [Trinickia violacea]|uniref:Thioredoxin domain-containing protein n=1 Tax=Trinickia violacea TaxID=2571746 RepID=A0A4P8ISL4_9BURK|nr:thioredoxin domain-containing protein [Trinickia violacea]QCP50243.1 thioredoxin domain-containing protein [Trinickia violacea]
MTNRLATETSPYLRQHAENPVDWYPWSDEAFRRARDEDKPILLSVGYAACHWCHVMAHESFENPRIASLMNERYINIKVDRQERPDIDDVYQQVSQMMGQGGGWPLTVFLTPQREPFFGGTYFPPDDRHGRPGLARVLMSLSEAWQHRKEELRETIAQFQQGFQQLDQAYLECEADEVEDPPAETVRALARNTDPVHGGLGGAPKFPNPSCYDLMLRVYHRIGERALLDALERTLDQMAAGGIYDQLGGGFARYSVDARWAVPHFEKMLYDNGQLVKLYANAYRLTGKEAWRRVVEETIAYVLRDMTHPDGGFHAGEDADSEGQEGKYYVWTPAEINAVLGESDGALACRAYGVTEHGNFEHGATVLHRAVELDAQQAVCLAGLRDRLLAARSRRARPARDDNILTGWNGLMIQGLCAAYQATGTVAYLAAAKRAADFIQARLTLPDGGVYRVWKDGTVKVPGFLEDYAFLSNALLDLYESCFDKRYLDRAEELVELILDKFWEDGLYFTPRDGEPLVHRPRAPYDNAWPSGLSSSVFAFLRLHALTGRDLYRDRAEHEFQRYRAATVRAPAGFAHLLAAQDFTQQGPLEIIFAGDKPGAAALVECVHRAYLPARVLAFADDVPIGQGRHPVEGWPAAYVCRNRTCAAPVTDGRALLEYCVPGWQRGVITT